ncbi:MAG: DUF3597 domain-containing protein [Treponema sp.]|jgi:hypothetical protein|nr:DUF3597 domain-containing protein [Treponema sp.]
MGILSSIKEKIFGKPAEPAKTTTTATKATTSPTANAANAAAAAKKAQAAMAAAAATPVDVVAIIEAAVKAKGVKSNWRESIVDLLKALDIDSSFAARKELADELKYNGAYSGTAEQNIWLHKTVMQMIADNGGKIPKELLR